MYKSFGMGQFCWMCIYRKTKVGHINGKKKLSSLNQWTKLQEVAISERDGGKVLDFGINPTNQ